MKTLDEKAAEYAAGVVAEFPELASYKGTIETIYGQGAMECELLGEETGTFGQALESLKRGHLVTRKEIRWHTSILAVNDYICFR